MRYCMCRFELEVSRHTQGSFAIRMHPKATDMSVVDVASYIELHPRNARPCSTALSLAPPGCIKGGRQTTLHTETAENFELIEEISAAS